VADANAYTQAINNAVASAKSMLGKNEVPNHAELQSYLHDGGQDLDPHKLAWCAAFVSASLQKAGLPVPTQVVKDSAFGPGAYAPNYLTYGNPVDPKNIQAGDILVNNNGSHVGFAEGPIRQGPNGPEAQLLAGNERDASGQYAPGSYTNPATGAVANRSQVGQVGERWVPLSQYSARRYQPTDDGSQPSTASSSSTSSSSSAPSGTTLNSNAIIDTLSKNIAQIESGGYQNPYEALGKVVPGRGQAIGKYQVMPENVPGWTQAALGKSMTPQEFQANPSAQEAVFRDQMQRSLQLYSPKDAASIWFTGKPYNVAGGAVTDPNKTNNASYVARATAGLPDSGTFTPGAAVAASAKPGTTINTSGAPTTPAGAPAVASAPGQPAPASGGWAGQLATALKPLSGGKGAGGGAGGGGDDQPPPMQLPMAPQARAMGGRMMMGPGGQNTFGAGVAEQNLAQQGFMMQPSLAANTLGATRPLVPTMMPGQATGIPGIPGTTLNSPSQLQMALMTGNISPYDMYANNPAFGSGFGST
jgi:hypothetical protein